MKEFCRDVRAMGMRLGMAGALLVAGLWASGAWAALPAADEQAVQQVALNQGLLDKLVGVKQDGQALGIAQTGVDPQTLTSLDAMSRAMLAKDPRIAGILGRHGLSGRQYAASVIAVMRAAVAAQMAGTPYAASAMKGTTAANVAFAKTHQAQLGALTGDGEDEDSGEDSDGQ